MTITSEYWRRCSSCKNPIAYKATYFVCSVSTCTRKRTGYVFCSVHCWERHLPGARHRDAAAIEAVAPSFDEWKREMMEAEAAEDAAPGAATGTPAGAPVNAKPAMPQAAQASTESKRFIVRESSTGASAAATTKSPPPPKEILIVASKLKAYVRARADMNTADAVMDTLSDQVRRLCDDAIDRARADGRKTVLERDFK